MNGDAPWNRYELGETVQQHQRISRTEAKHLPTGMTVWVDRLQPYYGDHAAGLSVAKELLSRHCQVAHPALPTLMDGWEHEGALAWVYKTQKGTPLRDFVKDHRPTDSALEPLVSDLSQGLIRLHRAGLFHGSLDVDSVVIAGKRRLALTKRGLRNQMNDMLNRSSVETGIDRTPSGSPLDDVTAWGELVGILITGEAGFGRVVVSSRSFGSFEIREAEETLRRKGLTGRIPEVVVRSLKAKSEPESSYPDLESAFRGFLDALAYSRSERERQT